MTEAIQVSRQGAVATIAFNRPERRNALAPELRNGFLDNLRALMADNDCRAIVSTGNGGAFCSGGDISHWNEGSPSNTDLRAGRARVTGGQEILLSMVRGPKPIIAAVEGVAYGAGMSIALACDYIVAASNARFCASFVKVGLMADMGLLWTLTQRVGVGRAKKLLTLGNEVKGSEAERIGMVDQAVEPGGALAAALEIAGEYAAAAPVAVTLTKAAFANGVATLDQVLRTEMDYQSILFQTQDHLDAIEAFLAKRTPVFKGR